MIGSHGVQISEKAFFREMDGIRTILTGLVLLLIACGPEEELVIGSEAPNFQAELTNGRLYELQDSRGGLVLLDFWASWCGPCLKELPELVRLNNEYAPMGLTIVSVALEKRQGVWLKAVERFGMDWKYQIVRDVDFVRFDEIASKYDVTEIPAKFLLDEEGNIIAARPTLKELEGILKERLH